MIEIVIVRNVTPQTDTYPMMGGATALKFQFKAVEGEHVTRRANLEGPLTFYGLLQEMGRDNLTYVGENPMEPGEYIFQSAINSTW